MRIRICMLTLVFLAMGGSSCMAQAAADSLTPVIQSIRAEYAAINAAAGSGRLRVVRKDVFGSSSEGGLMTNYLEGKEIRKTVLERYGVMGKNNTEYYFAHGKLLFCWSVDSIYNKPAGMSGRRLQKTEQNRYYFHQQKMVRWLGPDHSVFAPSIYEGRAKELMDEWNQAQAEQ